MQTPINIIGYLFAGYGLVYLIYKAFSGFCKWRTGRLNKKSECVERSLTGLEKNECRANYELYKGEPDVVHLSFDSFKSYYALNPDAWLLMEYFAYREKPGASEFAAKEARERYSKWGSADNLEQVEGFVKKCDSHYSVHFNAVEDYYRYVSFRKKKERQEEEKRELEQQHQRNEAQRKLTKEFLAAIQADIDHIRQLSEEEYGQALDTFSEVNERMSGGHKPVIEKPDSLGGVRQ